MTDESADVTGIRDARPRRTRGGDADARGAVTAFSERLRTATDAAHRDAEQSAFTAALLGGGLSGDAVTALLGQSYFVYEALERVGAEHTDPVVASFQSAELPRLDRLAADLEAARGPRWRAGLVPLPATNEYVARIEASATDGARYLAHHYLRYLGDLSGGQIIATLVRRHYGIPAERLSFYSFDEIAKPKLFKDAYRARLDSLGWDGATEDRFIDEAALGYRLNRRLFDELGTAAAA